MKPVLQVALDFLNLKRALGVAEQALRGGADWLEVGTPLIKSEGLQAVRVLRKKFPKVTIVADMKTMDVGRIETEAAAKAGADIMCVLGLASDSTIRECVEAGRNYGIKVVVDLIEVKEEDIVRRAREVQACGADFIGVHCPIDEQMQGKDPFRRLRKVAKAVTIPVGCAGGINSETAHLALKAGASIVVVGGAVTKDKDPVKAAREIKKAIEARKKVASRFFKRAGENDVRKVLTEVSCANLSDAMHRSGNIPGVYPLSSGMKMVGQALCVRTCPGDWAKAVEAIDVAEKGQVIVIDSGGVGPAVWGELATRGALQRKLSGVLVYGAVRDAQEIRALKFPVFSRLVTPQAGEPKGFGEIGVCVVIAGVRVCTSDWIIGDDDGVVCVPQARVVEVANRAMGVLEQENRIRTEINDGSTLGQVIELLKWEKAR